MHPPEDLLLEHEHMIDAVPRLDEALEDMVLHGVIADLRSVLWGLVGSGGSSFVSRIRGSSAEAGWAVKTPRRADDGRCLGRFAWERSCMRRVASAPAVRILVRQDHGYVLMEHVEGGTLRDLGGALRACPIAVRTRVARKAAESLLQVEDAGLLHCDVTPANLLLGRDGRVVVLDFHLAVERSRAREHRGVRRTRGYLSPERLQGVLSDAGEVFGLGATLHESLFRGTGADPRWSDLLERMLAPAPEARVSLREAAAELARMEEGGPSAGVPADVFG